MSNIFELTRIEAVVLPRFDPTQSSSIQINQTRGWSFGFHLVLMIKSSRLISTNQASSNLIKPSQTVEIDLQKLNLNCAIFSQSLSILNKFSQSKSDLASVESKSKSIH